MRSTFLAVSLLALAWPATAQVHAHPAANNPAGGQLVPGWQGRTDGATNQLSGVTFTAAGSGYRVKTGPAVVLWNPANQLGEQFTLSATFTAAQQPPREAYGIVFGAKKLDQPDTDYGYFLVRGDGSFMIRHRAGTELHTVRAWTKSEAVHQPDANGSVTNTLTFEAKNGTVRFLVNGTEVASFGPQWQATGVVGLRVNHNLDVLVTDFAITRK